MNSQSDILDRVGHPRILVLGDLILDRYTWGDAERVSPEAPVLILRVDTKEVRLGGAASVAMLLRGLEAEVTLAGVAGDDPEGRTLQALLRDDQIDSDLVLVNASRTTTTKERFIGRAANRHPHQILRVDHETRQPIGPELEERLSQEIIGRLDGCRGVLISDYSKGVCTPRLLQMVIGVANQRSIPVIVDPARITDYDRYRGATVLKPNRAEAELVADAPITTPEAALMTAKWLRQQHQLEAVLITLDRDGMVLVRADDVGEHFPTQPRTVYDITGAGDMVLAALGLCVASGISLPESVQMANAAAGLEVEKLGVAAVSREQLRQAVVPDAKSASPDPQSATRSRSFRKKLVSQDEAIILGEMYRQKGQSVVFTNGCFDLLHIGHVTCLREAAALGDILIVAINSDASVRQLKGSGRPVINERDRSALVAALDFVDHVLIFDAPTPHKLLEALRPDILVKGGTTAAIVGQEVVEAHGGRVCLVNECPGVSTSAIVSQVNSAFHIPHANAQFDPML